MSLRSIIHHNYLKMKKSNQGSSLIELLLYTALLGTVMMVTYGLFLQTSLARLASVNESSIYLNARRILFDLGQTIRQADSLTSPTLTNSGSQLSLDAGAIIYEVDNHGSLIKKEGSETNNLTNNEVVVENLTFQALGPSTIQPTVKISFRLKAAAEEQGKPKSQTFQTAISLR